MVLLQQLKESIQFVREVSKLRPRVGLTLGSGLSNFVSSIDVEATVPYKDIPHFAPSTVDGHPGNLILGKINDVPVVVMQGRIHYYEGHPMERVVYPTRMMAQMGIEKLILTNAAGGIDPKMQAGDFMLIRDHINLTGGNPLIGPNISELGLRFPDMSEAYDREMLERLGSILSRRGIRHTTGVYCGMSGPTYETPAEIHFLRSIGGNAVGMSTVPETIAAKHMGVRVCGISCITNLAAGMTTQKITHEEVKETTQMVEQHFSEFLVEFISDL